MCLDFPACSAAGFPLAAVTSRRTAVMAAARSNKTRNMDEHPGGGGAASPRPPPLQQHGSNPGPPIGTVMVPQQTDELARPQQQYTIPGILHYIQHEWARFEMERAHWEVERAELQARIAFLQGERKGQENLKNDLVRRIKMLEYALKQERAKYHKLKYGTELNQGEMKMPSFESGLKVFLGFISCFFHFFLNEVGYTDTILDVRTQRVRSLLGLSGSEQNGAVENKNLQHLINGTERCKDGKRSVSNPARSFCRTPGLLSLLCFWSLQVGNEGLATEDEAVTEEVMKEFDFLVTAEDGEGAGEARSSGDGTEWGESRVFKGNKTGFIRTDVVNLSFFSVYQRKFVFAAEPLPFSSGGGKSFLLGGSDDALENMLGLGDLADICVTNDEVDFGYDLSSSKESSFRKTWNPKYTLRSHFDGVRALAFHPVEPCLVSVSEDHTLKLWNLTKTVPAKKSASFDVEPIYTFRGHEGPVLSLAMTSTGEQCFSGGIDSTIQWWNIPGSNVDPYDTYDSSVLAGTWAGHTDAVWGLAYSGIKNRLLSCSADGTVKLWNPAAKEPCISTFNTDMEHGIPTSVDFNGCDPAHMVASFNGGDVAIYDLETSQTTVVLKGQGDGTDPSLNHINKVVSHPTLPITITAHEDRHIKFFDNKTGKLIHAMVAHLDAVTCLAVEPNGIYLISGSHDCSLRLWNLDTKTCVQEITAHRKKCEEAIYDVTFHPSKAYIASAGADALARVYV
uniref:Striatin-3 n=1 Tax=Oryzias sinensis TaxID=183150 RepID=A0A8C8DVJ6_9TELE